MRLLFVALFTVLATHVGAQETPRVEDLTPTPEKEISDKATDSSDDPWRTSVPVRIVETPDQASSARDREQKSEQHEAADLDAQQRAAKAAELSATSAERQEELAEWQVWLSGIGILAIAVTIIYSIKATNAAVAAANAAEHTNVITKQEQRAWVNISLVPYRPVSPLNGGFYSQITLNLDNIGKSVAMDVRAFIRPYLLNTSDNTPRANAEEWLKGRIANRHAEEVARIIFPGETISWEPDLAMRPDEFNGGRPFILRVSAMVEYTTAEVDGPRRTYTNFDISGSDTGGVSRVINLEEGDLATDRIRVSKNGIGYAT